MIRWIVAIFYLLVGPALVRANWPYQELAGSLSVASALAGLAVACVHWRQPTTLGRVFVAVGTGVGCFAGGAVWAAGMLLFAFASDSGEYAETLGKLMTGLTHAVILVAPPLGALAGSGTGAAWRRRKEPPNS